MKTIIKSLFFALSVSVLTSFAALGEGNPERPATAASFKSGVYTTTQGKLSIALDKQTGGTVDVRLKNSEGAIVYSKRLSKNESTCRMRLDMSELPDGAYQLEITNGVEMTKQNVTLSTKKPTMPSRLVAVN